jgi:hypothetical protein
MPDDVRAQRLHTSDKVAYMTAWSNFRMEGSMLRAVSRVVLIVGAAALGAAGAIAWRADLLVGYGFGRALEAETAALPFERAAQPVANAEVGDEGYWLTRSTLEGQAPFDRHLAVGNRITVSGVHGHTRTLEVVEIASAGTPLLKVAEDSAPVRLVRVTARVVGATEAGHSEPVHFYVEVENKPKATPLSTAPQAQLGGT